MPVTAKLSRKFYERFGDEIANEFVDWFNAVDATYQGQLKDINEANWNRMDARFSAFDARIDALEVKLNARMDAFEAKIDAKLSRQRMQLIAWMFGFWTATVVPIIGVTLAVSGALRR